MAEGLRIQPEEARRYIITIMEESYKPYVDTLIERVRNEFVEEEAKAWGSQRAVTRFAGIKERIDTLKKDADYNYNLTVTKLNEVCALYFAAQDEVWTNIDFNQLPGELDVSAIKTRLENADGAIGFYPNSQVAIDNTNILSTNIALSLDESVNVAISNVENFGVFDEGAEVVATLRNTLMGFKNQSVTVMRNAAGSIKQDIEQDAEELRQASLRAAEAVNISSQNIG